MGCQARRVQGRVVMRSGSSTPVPAIIGDAGQKLDGSRAMPLAAGA